jgi:pilus assembly protein CpaF
MTLEFALVTKLQLEVGDRMAEERARRARDGFAPLVGDMERQFARQVIANVLRDHTEKLLAVGEPPLTQEEEDELQGGLYARMYGAGPLQQLLDDSQVEDIDIVGADEVWVTRAGRDKERLEKPLYPSDEELRQSIQRLARWSGLNERRWDEANPKLDLTLPDGSRLTALTGVTPRPVVSIRRHRFEKVELGDLVGNGTLSDAAGEFCDAIVKARYNILMSGATGSGKTTMLRALTRSIEPGERLVTIENVHELFLARNGRTNVVEMEARHANTEGVGAITMAEMVEWSRRLNPDRVIVGEVLGPEILAMLEAMMQGNDGSMSTIHARSAREAFEQITIYAQRAEGLSREVVQGMVAAGLDFVIYMTQDLRTGQRRVATILEIAGYDAATGLIATNEIFGTDGRNPGAGARRTEYRLTPRRETKLGALGWSEEGSWS